MLGSSLLVLVNELFLTHLLLRLSILLTLCPLLRSSLLNLLHLRNLGTCEDAADTVIHLIDHSIPYLRTLEFEDQEWVFLLIGCILY